MIGKFIAASLALLAGVAMACPDKAGCDKRKCKEAAEVVAAKPQTKEACDHQAKAESSKAAESKDTKGDTGAKKLALAAVQGPGCGEHGGKSKLMQLAEEAGKAAPSAKERCSHCD
jgi:hypothetical protein